jgi:hypothetical protein
VRSLRRRSRPHAKEKTALQWKGASGKVPDAPFAITDSRKLAAVSPCRLRLHDVHATADTAVYAVYRLVLQFSLRPSCLAFLMDTALARLSCFSEGPLRSATSS